MNKVLLTGAGGFIGSHLAEALLVSGCQVRVLAHYNSRQHLGNLHLLDPKLFSALEVVTGDLMDAEGVRAAMSGCDTVFHLGALIGIPYSYANPNHVFQANAQGTLNVLLAARSLNVGRVIHTSTSEVYGTARIVPISEEHPLQAQSPYAASKVAADKLAESFHLSYGLPVVTVRPFNTYGPRQSARAVIPTIISQALRGGEVHLGTLESRRDFTFVTDTVAGFLAAAQTPAVEGHTFNLGVGEDNTIGEIAEIILRQVRDLLGPGHDISIALDPARLRPQNSEVMRLISDNRKARSLLGWAPRVSLEQGLAHTIRWVQQNPRFFRTGVYEV